jgi:hypothetical protein
LDALNKAPDKNTSDNIRQHLRATLSQLKVIKNQGKLKKLPMLSWASAIQLQLTAADIDYPGNKPGCFGATMETVLLAVNGTLMQGLELNGNLLAVGAEFVRQATTEPVYMLWSIHDRHPAMLRVQAGGAAIAVEVWRVPLAGLGKILLQEPPGLCIGKVRLADGEIVLGVLGEPFLCEGQRNITAWGGWRSYCQANCQDNS